MAQQLINGKQQFIDGNGNPLAGGSVAFYQPGTLTPVNTYQDPGLTIPNTNPVVLDANGMASVWGADGTQYRQVVANAAGVQLWDQVVGSLVNALAELADPAQGAALVAYKSAMSGAVQRTVAARLNDIVTPRDFGAVGDGVTDDTAAFNAAINSVRGKQQYVYGCPYDTYRVTGTLFFGKKESSSGVIQNPAWGFRGRGCTILADFSGSPVIDTTGVDNYPKEYDVKIRTTPSALPTYGVLTARQLSPSGTVYSSGYNFFNVDIYGTFSVAGFCNISSEQMDLRGQSSNMGPNGVGVVISGTDLFANAVFLTCTNAFSFTHGEIITGSTSGAKLVVLVKSTNGVFASVVSGALAIGETITGTTSDATGTVQSVSAVIGPASHNAYGINSASTSTAGHVHNLFAYSSSNAPGAVISRFNAVTYSAFQPNCGASTGTALLIYPDCLGSTFDGCYIDQPCANSCEFAVNQIYPSGNVLSGVSFNNFMPNSNGGSKSFTFVGGVIARGFNATVTQTGAIALSNGSLFTDNSHLRLYSFSPYLISSNGAPGLFGEVLIECDAQASFFPASLSPNDSCRIKYSDGVRLNAQVAYLSVASSGVATLVSGSLPMCALKSNGGTTVSSINVSPNVPNPYSTILLLTAEGSTFTLVNGANITLKGGANVSLSPGQYIVLAFAYASNSWVQIV